MDRPNWDITYCVKDQGLLLPQCEKCRRNKDHYDWGSGEGRFISVMKPVIRDKKCELYLQVIYRR
jgi:hypothetical protein